MTEDKKSEDFKMTKSSTVLVVGDFFIDENWLMARTDNYHSTDVGKAHYDSQINGPNSFVSSVCGAATVLKTLAGSKDESDFTKAYQFIGMGGMAS